MNLIEQFENKSPDKIIETIVSKIFFYGRKVVKVYKYEKFFFGDFSSPKFRKEFYAEDFYWNNLTAPKIYLKLNKIKDVGAEDFYIEMEKFDDSKNLTNLLMSENIQDGNLKVIVDRLIAKQKELTKNRKEKYMNFFKRNLYDIHLEDLEGDRKLLHLIPEKIPKRRADKIVDTLKMWSEKSLYYKNFKPENLSILIDDHADNILFENGEAQFVDILPPKESWRVGDINFSICRFATDTAVLGTENKLPIIYCESTKLGHRIPEEIKLVYQARSALIQAWCFYATKKPEIAQKYLEFAEKSAFSLQVAPLDLSAGFG